MKKLLALILCLVMMITLVACGESEEKDTEEEKESKISETSDTSEPTSETEPEAEEESQSDSEMQEEETDDHSSIGYKGQKIVFAPEELASIEGRECDFTYEQNGTTIYIYNEVTVETMSFKQVQFTFNEDHNRISCTYTIDAGTEDAPRAAEEIAAEMEQLLADYRETLTSWYGEGAESEQHGYKLISWRDAGGNYVILTQINDKTAQVAYYIYAK